MTTPKKPLSKTESAIQLGNILKGGGRGGGSKKSVIKKIKKLLKIGEKPSKVSKSAKIKEVQTKEKKSLQNQNQGPVHPGLGGRMTTANTKPRNPPYPKGESYEEARMRYIKESKGKK